MKQKRIESVLRNLDASGLSQLLVSDPRSIQYLTGMYVEPGERFLGLLLRNGGSQPTLFLNELFTAPDDIAVDVVPFNDTDDPLELLAARCDADADLGCDKNLPARFLIPMMERRIASAFTLASAAVDAARAIKDDREHELMRSASAVNDEAMERFRTLVHEGVTEAEVAAQLEGIYRDLGASGHSFEPIVSFGANAADPHHEPDGTVLESGDVVLFDVGCRKDEGADEEQRRVYEIVRQANEAGRKAVRPGARFCDIDAAAREVIENAGYGQYFTHRLGHQIGLDVHEPGDVSAANEACVQPGMCFSIEPGIYLPGRFGVRIEDLVIVTEDGCEVLNAYPRDLSIVR